MLRLLSVALVFLVIALYITNKHSDSNGISIPEITLPTVNSKDLSGPYHVLYVIDGDTFITDIDGVETKIRLIGVDTPESVNEVNPEKNCEEGRIASAYTKELLSDKNVWLEFDVQRNDDYGRTLAYVYLDNAGTDMLQERLLKDGMANMMTVGSNIKYLFKFRFDAAYAKSNKKGFWEEGFWNE